MIQPAGVNKLRRFTTWVCFLSKAADKSKLATVMAWKIGFRTRAIDTWLWEHMKFSKGFSEVSHTDSWSIWWALWLEKRDHHTERSDSASLPIWGGAVGAENQQISHESTSTWSNRQRALVETRVAQASKTCNGWRIVMGAGNHATLMVREKKRLQRLSVCARYLRNSIAELG